MKAYNLKIYQIDRKTNESEKILDLDSGDLSELLKIIHNLEDKFEKRFFYHTYEITEASI